MSVDEIFFLLHERQSTHFVFAAVVVVVVVVVVDVVVVVVIVPLVSPLQLWAQLIQRSCGKPLKNTLRVFAPLVVQKLRASQAS